MSVIKVYHFSHSRNQHHNVLRYKNEVNWSMNKTTQKNIGCIGIL